MHKLAKLMVAGAALGACAGSPGDERSCAEMAQAKAAGQLERESALLEQQERGHPEKSEVQRKFIEMDAEAYQRAVYEECLRHRGPTAEDR
jgi:hypothetical protein